MKVWYGARFKHYSDRTVKDIITKKAGKRPAPRFREYSDHDTNIGWYPTREEAERVLED